MLDLNEDQLRYVNMIAPTHSRNSCGGDEGYAYNAAYDEDDYGGFGRCYRCTLIHAAIGLPEQGGE